MYSCNMVAEWPHRYGVNNKYSVGMSVVLVLVIISRAGRY